MLHNGIIPSNFAFVDKKSGRSGAKRLRGGADLEKRVRIHLSARTRLTHAMTGHIDGLSALNDRNRQTGNTKSAPTTFDICCKTSIYA